MRRVFTLLAVVVLTASLVPMAVAQEDETVLRIASPKTGRH